jgi:uncharacterized protein (TIGR03435 family)
MRYKLSLSLLFAAAAFGQTGSAPLEFEVASVKPCPPPEGQSAVMMARMADMTANLMPVGQLPVKGVNVSIKTRTLQQLVASAYMVRPNEVSGPDWISELRFDIEARMPEGATAKQANDMLKTLLEKRFGLRTHREDKTMAAFVLTVGKDGPRLTPGVPPKPMSEDPEERKAQMEKMMEENRKRMTAMSAGGARPANRWHSDNATAAQIATAISNIVKAPVVDQTGLEGKYDATIEVPQPDSPDDTIEARTAQAVSKLGLKLDSKKTAIPMVVVDAASKTPTEN